MATKSMLKNIVIKESDKAEQFVTALENAGKFSGKPVQISKLIKRIEKDQIDKLFTKAK